MIFPRPHPRRAFTLVEIMLALMIFSMVVMAIYSTWMVVMRAAQVGQNVAVRAQRQRVALRTIEDGLMGIQSFQASQKYYSFILAGGSSSQLSFAARVPDIFPRNGTFGDFNLRRLTFSLESDGKGYSGGNNLVLRQNPILMDVDENEQKYPLVLAHNVKQFIVECWSTNKNSGEWVTEWETTNAIPPMIRVGLVLGGEATASGKGFAASDQTVVRAFSVPSEMMPAAVQHGTMGGGSGSAPAIKLPGMK
jgi:prepilin-type N-terminal cleavage/methylation domain-containing protein